MATLPAASAPSVRPTIPDNSSSSLHRRFVIGAAASGVVAILLLAAGAYTFLQRNIRRQGDQMLREAAHRSTLVLEGALAERTRETDVLALMPGVVAAARQGNAHSVALGLDKMSIAALETRFTAEHSMMLAPETRLVLRELLPHFSARDVLLTDAFGYNALITHSSADFVQSDEAWWQDAWRAGRSISDAAYDPASRTTIVALSSVIRDGPKKLGVLKVKYDVTPLVVSLASAGAGVRIDVLDSTGRILLSSESRAMGSMLPPLPASDSTGAMQLTVGSVDERALALPANANRWRVVAHVPDASIAAPFHTARLAIFGTAAALLAVLATLLFALHRFLSRRITTPVGDLAAAAEAVALGDFSVQLRHVSSDDEIGRLARAVGSMILELRRLALEIASSSHETNVMSSEITAGSEEMAATAGEIASTASDLSVQASQMAETVGSLAASAGSLRALAAELETGAGEGVSRNATLRTLANANRLGLDASAVSLSSLGDDVHASATAIEALASASVEIRSFVNLVRKLARQSKLLALNAAMEAARAGEQGEGFAVVASEVRRLSAMSSDAAERTEAVVTGVLNGIEESRASSGRAVAMADQVRAATSQASASFAQIERAVVEADAWTAAIKKTSTTTSHLVEEMTGRLEELTVGTESFAAAMEQVAASSQEQSAATQEIAGAAGTLVSAAHRLTRLVGELTLGEAAVGESSANANATIPAPATTFSMPVLTALMS